ncbi:MAG TPA: sensor histidine kinase [Oligoflexus sp.]|uniref:sensor histidine kinase n=1 Tax=Oligoflexus sp. TaxID=1971216 RepID=UPI002D7F6A2D|nr:sensor histidine kinase [Oligoflexus sp.]HET9241141.1 sensor histidine kinase [Oligoflexus sp.]
MHLVRMTAGMLISFLWLMLAPKALGVSTAPVVTLDLAGTTNIGDRFLLLTDNRSLDIHSISEKDHAGAFQIPSPADLNGGYSESIYWIKLSLHNPTPEQEWFLVAETPYMQFDVWRVHPDAAPTLLVAGSDAKNFVPLTLASGSQAVFYLRMHTPYIADLKFHLMNREHLNRRNYKQTVFASLIAGCFLAMIIYNFFLFMTLRDKNYLYYLLFGLVNSHLNLLAVNFPTGIDYAFGWNWWAIMPYYVPMAPLVTFLFARSFLQSRYEIPRLDKVLLAYMGGLLLWMMAGFIVPASTHLNLLNVYMLLGVFLLILAGCRSLMKGYQPARFFLAGIGTFLIGILMLLLRSVGVLPSNFFTNNIHLLAQAAEMMLMSMALAHRIKLLEDAKTRAEVTAEVKSGLLRIISHDIVTPLTVVKATAWQLKKEVTDPSRVERVVRAASIIEEIVGFIRKKEMMENGEALALGAVLLRNTFDELAFLFHDRAQEKNIDLHFELEHSELAVLAEPVSLSNEVLGNLIANAIKFSFPGSPVRIRADRAKNGHVTIIIQDQGMGMDKATVARLFDSSIKQSRVGTQGEKGIGFGMPLAKAYVDAYGGRIEAQSQNASEASQNQGTTICITLKAATVLP